MENHRLRALHPSCIRLSSVHCTRGAAVQTDKGKSSLGCEGKEDGCGKGVRSARSAFCALHIVVQPSSLGGAILGHTIGWTARCNVLTKSECAQSRRVGGSLSTQLWCDLCDEVARVLPARMGYANIEH